MSKQRLLLDGIEAAIEARASDLHVRPGGPWRLRIAGELTDLPIRAQPSEVEAELVNWIEPRLRARIDELVPTTSVRTVNDVRVRGHVVRERSGLGGVFRLLLPGVPNAKSLGVGSILAPVARLSHGLVVISGPAGSGKTSTAAALLEEINAERAVQIMTIEDPIEYVFTSRQGMVLQRELGRDSSSLGSAIEVFMTMDPGVLFTSELSDARQAGLLVAAAVLGHLVITTLTAPDTVAAIRFLVNAAGVSLANVLGAVVHQRLVRAPSGLLAAVELLLVNSVVAGVIRQDRLDEIPSLLQAGESQGMRSLSRSLAEIGRSVPARRA